MADSSKRRTAIGPTPRCQTREKEHNANGMSAAHSFVCTQNLIFINGNTHQVIALLCERSANVCFCLLERLQTHNVAEDNGTAKFKEHTNRNHFAFCRNYRPRSERERERKCVLIIIALFAFLSNRARWFGHIFLVGDWRALFEFSHCCYHFNVLNDFRTFFNWLWMMLRVYSQQTGDDRKSHRTHISTACCVCVLTMNEGGKSFG